MKQWNIENNSKPLRDSFEILEAITIEIKIVRILIKSIYLSSPLV